MEFAFFGCFFFFSFLFSFLHLLETGKINPPPPNEHARILANAEFYGRSLSHASLLFLPTHHVQAPFPLLNVSIKQTHKAVGTRNVFWQQCPEQSFSGSNALHSRSMPCTVVFVYEGLYRLFDCSVKEEGGSLYIRKAKKKSNVYQPLVILLICAKDKIKRTLLWLQKKSFTAEADLQANTGRALFRLEDYYIVFLCKGTNWLQPFFIFHYIPQAASIKLQLRLSSLTQ